MQAMGPSLFLSKHVFDARCSSPLAPTDPWRTDRFLCSVRDSGSSKELEGERSYCYSLQIPTVTLPSFRPLTSLVRNPKFGRARRLTSEGVLSLSRYSQPIIGSNATAYTMKSLLRLVFAVLALLLLPSSASSQFVRSLGSSNATATGQPEGRFGVEKRCPKSDVCFNNPGFFNGFRMYKIREIRNGYTCTSRCIPTGACISTACTGNFFFFTLGLKDLFGWECGRCPQ
jgi:hypothetical protein